MKLSKLSWRLSPLVALLLALLVSVSVYAWPGQPPITPSNLAPGYNGAWPGNDGAQLGGATYPDPAAMGERLRVLVRQVVVERWTDLDDYRAAGWKVYSFQTWGSGFLATLRMIAVAPPTVPLLVVPGAAVQQVIQGCTCAQYWALPPQGWRRSLECPGSPPCS